MYASAGPYSRQDYIDVNISAQLINENRNLTAQYLI